MVDKQSLRDLLENDKIFRQISDVSKIPYELSQENLGALLGKIISSKKLLDKDVDPPTYLAQIPVIDDKQQPSFLGPSKGYEAAIRYFYKNLDIVVANAIQDLFIETIYKVISVQGESGIKIGKETEYKAFNLLLKARMNREKKRIGLRRSTKGKLFWTTEKRREVLEEYERLLALTKAAKKTFNKHYELPTIEKTLRENVPGLPEDIYNAVLQSARISPKDLVLNYLIPKYKDTTISYFNIILMRARAEEKIPS